MHFTAQIDADDVELVLGSSCMETGPHPPMNPLKRFEIAALKEKTTTYQNVTKAGSGLQKRTIHL